MKKSTQSLLMISLTIWGGATYAQTTNNLLSPVGKVGIGTITPQSRLHVVGNTKIDSALTARTLNIMQLSTYQGDAIFQRRLGVAGLTVLDSVTIGGPIEIPVIGDALVNQTLEVLMRDSITGKVLKGGDDVLKDLMYRPGVFPCRDNAGGNITPENPVWNNSPGILYTNTLCVPDVKVGIGLASPLAKLHIQTRTGRTTHPILVTKDDGSNTKIMQLDATGLLYAREIKVNLDAWPDYVFDATYQLMPIKTLEQYIQTNKHLPGVPSACEVEENGLSLGEMNKILLEKLEEITLRMIEQEKRISELETNAVTKN